MSGQIGNQIFQFMAAILYASSTNRKTNLKYQDYKYSENDAKHMWIHIERSLPIDFPQQRSKVQRYLALKFYAVTLKIEIIRKIRSIFFKDYFTSEIGYSPNFFLERKYREIHGYFQTYLISRQLEILGIFPKFEISDPTDWYSNAVSEMESKSVLVLHIRRGDYYEFNDSFGILSEQYYYDAARLIKSKVRIDETWIFTNDTADVINYFNLGNFHNPKIMLPPKSSHPLESMLLMSYGRAIVIANSSFSWWSAYLAPNSSLILAPRKWFKGILDPKDLLPPEWFTLESDWKI